MLAGEDLVADAHDQIVPLLVEPPALVVGDGGGALQDRVGADHLARHQVVADAEILQRALGLRAPQPVGGNRNLPEAVAFDPDVAHAVLLRSRSVLICRR